MRLFLGQIQAARKKVTQENSRAASNVETIRQMSASGSNSAQLREFLDQIVQQNEEQKRLLKRVFSDTTRLIDKNKQLEDNYTVALQKRDEFEQKIKEFEDSKLAANFGADFSAPVHIHSGNSQQSPGHGREDGSPRDECQLKLDSPQNNLDQGVLEDEDDFDQKAEKMEPIEQKIYYGQSVKPELHDDHDMFAGGQQAAVQKDALDSIFEATQNATQPTQHADDDFFHDEGKHASHKQGDDDDDMFGGAHDQHRHTGHADHGLGDQRLEEMLAKDSDDEHHDKKKADPKDVEDFFN